MLLLSCSLCFSRVIYGFYFFLSNSHEHGENWKDEKKDSDCQVDKVPAQGFKDWTLSWPIERFAGAIENLDVCLEDDMKVMWVNESK